MPPHPNRQTGGFVETTPFTFAVTRPIDPSMTNPERAAALRRWTRCAALVAALLPLASGASRADSQPAPEARAAVLAQALRFVAWPASVAPGTALRVAVVGNPALGAALRIASAGVQPGGRTVTVVDVATLRHLDAAKPAVVVLGAMPAAESAVLVESLSRRGVVTIGDGECPENRQLLLNLRATGSRYRVQANQHTAALAGVNLSARLLSLAQIVD